MKSILKLSSAVLLFVLTLASSANAQKRRLYMLEKPIEQTGELKAGGAFALMGATFAWDAFKIGVLYPMVFHHAANTDTAALVIEGLKTIGLYVPETRLLATRIAQNAQRKQIKELAPAPEIKNIKVLTLGHTEQHYLLATHYSRSFIFVETEGETTFAEDGWTEIDQLENTRLDLNLSIEGTEVGTQMSFPLVDILNGTTLDPGLQNEWAATIDEWSKTIPLLDRFVTKQTAAKDLMITAKLEINGEKKDLGIYASGIAAKKFLKKQRLLKTLKYIFLYPDPDIFLNRISTQSQEVGESKKFSEVCSKLMSGFKLLFLPSPAK